MELALQFIFVKIIIILILSHNPCFYGISFAISEGLFTNISDSGHNPCFYGISFAIENNLSFSNFNIESQSLFLWN